VQSRSPERSAIFAHPHPYLAMRALQIVLAVTMAGCVSARPSPPAQAVRLVGSRNAVKDCAPLGVVDASDHVPSGGTSDRRHAESEEHRRIRAAAARLGANTLLLSDIPVGMNRESPTIVRGEAYKC
jgi:Domain of unknown function (DUF4156)